MSQGKRYHNRKKNRISSEVHYSKERRRFTCKNYDNDEEEGWAEYYLASMFPNDAVMHRVYSIIRKRNQHVDSL